MKNIAQQLKKMSSNMPEPTRTEMLKKRVMAQIRLSENTTIKGDVFILLKETVETLVFPWRFARVFGMVFTLCLGILFVSVGAAVGAYFSDPGEPLYDVSYHIKRVSFVVMTPEMRVERVQEWAAEDMRALVTVVSSSQETTEKSKKIEQIARQLSQNLEDAQKNVVKVNKTNVAHAVKRQVTQMKKSFEQVTVAVHDSNINSKTSTELEKVSLKMAQAELSALGALINAVEEEGNTIKDVVVVTPQQGPKEKEGAAANVNEMNDVVQGNQPQINTLYTDEASTTQENSSGLTYDSGMENSSAVQIEIEEDLFATVQKLRETIKIQQNENDSELSLDETVLHDQTVSQSQGESDVLLNIEEVITQERQNIEKEAQISKGYALLEEADVLLQKKEYKQVLLIIEKVRDIIEDIEKL